MYRQIHWTRVFGIRPTPILQRLSARVSPARRERMSLSCLSSAMRLGTAFQATPRKKLRIAFLTLYIPRSIYIPAAVPTSVTRVRQSVCQTRHHRQGRRSRGHASSVHIPDGLSPPGISSCRASALRASTPCLAQSATLPS